MKKKILLGFCDFRGHIRPKLLCTKKIDPNKDTGVKLNNLSL